MRVYHPSVIGDRTTEEWVERYATSHQHPVNRACHTLGIPLIVISIGLFALGFFSHRFWHYAWALFLVGWIFQFVGHIFEGKPPEFFRDWRFLFVGVRWWWAKIQGKERAPHAGGLIEARKPAAVLSALRPTGNPSDGRLKALAGKSGHPPD